MTRDGSRHTGTTPAMALDLPAAGPPALAVHNIQIVYGGAIEAVRDV